MEALGSYRRAVKSFNILTKKVRFIDYPMDPVTDIVPEGHEKVSKFKGLVELIEKRLRRKERVYIFSRDGHGRAGFLSACLLGHLYGLDSNEALECVQRAHDSRVDMSILAKDAVGSPTAKWRGNMFQRKLGALLSRGPRKSYVSCPRLSIQSHFVRQFLEPMFAMYNPTELRDDSGPVTKFILSREEIFASTQGHMKNKFKEERERQNRLQDLGEAERGEVEDKSA